MIKYDYEYDLINQPYLAEIIDFTSGWTHQSFRVPTSAHQLQGLRIKLSRLGHPGPVEVRLGRSPGSQDLAQGTIDPEAVLPVFELWTGFDFPPVPVQAGEICFLSLRVASGRQPLEAYRLYGPNIYDHVGGPESVQLPYFWNESVSQADDLPIPLPADYRGAAYPNYPDGERRRADGSLTWSLSFQILTDGDAPEATSGAQPFEFARQLLAPPFTEWVLLRDVEAQPGPQTVVIDDRWALVTDAAEPSPVMEQALIELRTFFQRVLDVPLAEAGGTATIQLEIRPKADLPPGEESFLARIQPDGIRLSARHERGLLRAVYWLEDSLLLQRAPFLEPGEYRVQARYSPRMVPGIYPAPAYAQLFDGELWTAGYMWRLSRAGYNAIYLQANMEDFVEASAIFPEMNDPRAAAAIERLRRITELGAAYGVDVYVDLKTGYRRKFSEAVYERRPEVRSYARFGNYPCSGQESVLEFYTETVTHVFQRAEKLKGLIVIYDTEGFFSCFIHNQQRQCPTCKDQPVVTLATRLFEALLKGIRAGNTAGELILWSYFCDEPWNYDVIRAMPAEASLMACFSQFGELDRFGVRVRTDDYSICSEKPSAYFLKLQALAKEKQLRFLCKTEDTFGQEFVSTPYTPCLTQHQRRWDEVRASGVDGFLSQYVHLGFMPGPCADLMRQNALLVENETQPQTLSAETKLRRVATLHAGAAAAELVMLAWEAFSRALRDYFPYTWGVCRYPGPLQAAPAQPFYLDPARRVPRSRARGYVKDLNWTGIDPRFLVDPDQTWDAALVSRCLQGFVSDYAEGLRWLEAARRICAPPYQAVVDQALRIARTQRLQAQSLMHLIEFFQLREADAIAGSDARTGALIAVCEAERETAAAALAICRQDSVIGFTCEGAGNVRGGAFTPVAIEQKLTGLAGTLAALCQRRPGSR